MARDWSKEPYRKQLLRPSPSFRMLSVSAQGLFYVLMREADDDGFLPFATTFEDGCVRLRRLLGVHNEERRSLPKHLTDLLNDGCVEHVGEQLHLRSLRAINERRDRSSNRQDGESGGRPRTGRGQTSDERRTGVAETLVEHTPNTGGALVEHRRSIGETLVEQRRDIDQGSSAGNRSTESRQPSRARARLQVGREVGREEDLPLPPSGGTEERAAASQGPSPLVALLAECPKLSHVDLGNFARGLDGIAMTVGASPARLLEVVRMVNAMILTEAVEGPHVVGWYRKTATRLMRPGQLERERNGGDGTDRPSPPSSAPRSYRAARKDEVWG